MIRFLQTKKEMKNDYEFVEGHITVKNMVNPERVIYKDVPVTFAKKDGEIVGWKFENGDESWIDENGDWIHKEVKITDKDFGCCEIKYYKNHPYIKQALDKSE